MKESKEAAAIRKATVEYEAKVLNRIYAITEALRQEDRALMSAARAWNAAVDLQRRLHELYDEIANDGMTDLIHGPMTTFVCLRCACRLGVWPETARGVAALCCDCAALPPTIHDGWIETPPARLGQSAAERRRAA